MRKRRGKLKVFLYQVKGTAESTPFELLNSRHVIGIQKLIWNIPIKFVYDISNRREKKNSQNSS